LGQARVRHAADGWHFERFEPGLPPPAGLAMTNSRALTGTERDAVANG
jgi:hypothetical protein